MRKTYVWAAVAVLVAIAFTAMARNNGPKTATAGTLEEGPVAPAFTTTTTEGKTVSLADYKGKVVLLDFWATWCPPCRDEAPNIVSTSERFRERGFEVLGISLDREKSELKSFTAEYRMDWPQVFDADSDNEIARKYDITAVPTMLLIDGDTGRILAENPRGEDLPVAVAAALAQKGL